MMKNFSMVILIIAGLRYLMLHCPPKIPIEVDTIQESPHVLCKHELIFLADLKLIPEIDDCDLQHYR